MKRRDFLKGVGAGAVGVSSLNAGSFISDELMNDEAKKVSASHFGAFKAFSKNGKFEGIDHIDELDFFPVSLTQGVVARTYDETRIAKPAVRKGYLEKGYKSDKSKRGKDEWVEISWDEAYKLVADELKRVYKEYGGQSIYGGSYGWYCVGSVNNPQALLGRMLNILGGYTTRTLNYSQHAISAITPHITGVDEGNAAVTAWPVVLEHSEVVVLWGADPLNTNQIAWGVPDHESYIYFKKLKEQMKKRGLKVINIDPVYNNTAKYLNAEHIAVNPTTDVPLMMAICYEMIKNGTADENFLKKYTSGAEAFKKYLLGEAEDKVVKDAKWAAKICGISEDEIKNLAKIFGSKRTMIMGGWGPQRARHGEQFHWMAITLASFIGQIGLPGGGFGFAYHYSDGGTPSPAMPVGSALSLASGKATTSSAFPGLGQIGITPSVEGEWKNRSNIAIPVSRILDCINNPGLEIDFNCKKLTFPQIKMAYWAGGNPFHHHPDTNLMAKTFEKLDTFIVQDCFWTASARMADIVLPASTEQERNDITKIHTNKKILAMHKIAEPYGEAKSDYEIYSGILAQFGETEVKAFTEGRDAMGWIKHFYEASKKKADESGLKMPSFDEFWEKGYAEFKVPESAKEYVKMADFRKNPITNRLGTPSGKIEIFSKKIEKAGYSDCKAHPTWMEPEEWLGSKKAEKYPLNLVTPHPKYRLHSQLNNTWLRDLEEIKGREPVWIHPDDAKARKLQNGDIVRVFNDRGELLAGVVVTENVKKGVIRMQEGAWWDPDKDGLCVHGNVNVLVPNDKTSSLACGNQATALVQIEKFKDDLPTIKVFSKPKFKA
ncbi:molybdopterin-dependent oxidoreductase [Campylobacter mucosalis]|uniref:Molybdopterin-containing oxidoreductase IV, DMSO/TMAO/BSO reductase family, catalytic subunit n=1 Tax=Campylobacter mucosalis CCUG 21559 TaxID=1032067 RepID=A0A6G5QF83_9BACT|nr:molybdopterin-dependent oxidoreductase [Campylobacter mucosalis]QCD44227.1 molybdopterin-containing oxidoreductase IV, DMSO/TMAO/BSO reductase family, catalytic subunit [Campylobacter mucosalis CCUG 21559]